MLHFSAINLGRIYANRILDAKNNGDIELTKAFIAVGANVNAIDDFRTTPIQMAIMQSRIEIAELLFKE